jgi:hypothetical protein
MGMTFVESTEMEKRTFAFRLADKRENSGKWKAREGVSLAGCTELPNHNYRDNIFWPGGQPAPEDGGYFC